jgi:hypothetical protein
MKVFKSPIPTACWCDFLKMIQYQYHAEFYVNNIITIFLKCIAMYGRIFDEEFGSRWACLGSDEFFLFQKHCIKVILQLKSNFIFLLAIVVFSKLPLVYHIE